MSRKNSKQWTELDDYPSNYPHRRSGKLEEMEEEDEDPDPLGETMSMTHEEPIELFGFKKKWKGMFVLGALTLSVIAFIVSIIAISNVNNNNMEQVESNIKKENMVKRITFGSCSTFTNVPQPIWRNGVIPRDPDVWVWNGDFVYMDVPIENCSTEETFKDCNCSNTDWLKIPPHSCFAGDVDHSIKRVGIQLQNRDYNDFLEYMCPDFHKKMPAPPTGTDPSVCPKTILGVYDDHDYSWNNGDRRLPNKNIHKEIYLDAIGEPKWSERRSTSRGIEWKYTFNEGTENEIGVFLLDERYHREPLPCYIERDYCTEIINNQTSSHYYGWCLDYLHGGEDGRPGKGSCCMKDEQIYFGWCKNPSNRNHPFWGLACDPTWKDFGSRSFVYDEENDDLKQMGQFSTHESPFCEVLGFQQREWLRQTLEESKAKVNLVFSPSVLFSNPDYCSDDFDCYRPAQVNLLSTLSKSASCVVVLTGDFHHSDIKVVKPGSHSYSEILKTSHLRHPIYQVMASGMTSEVVIKDKGCERKDPYHFRDHEECQYVTQPAFGEVDIDWKNEKVFLRVISEQGDILLESSFNLNECQVQFTK